MAKTLEKNLDKVSQEVNAAVEDVKETMNEVGGRWNKSSREEKITTILGILLLLRGLWRLKTFIRGILLLILGGLLVSGYFNKWLKPLFIPSRKSKKPKEEKAKPASKAIPAKKSKKK
ncbi:MAG: hypothetical protein LBG52_05100 [Candidatus Peribacteria bacterium]|jgi:hypothetical protein|nr:hypothetical protein [Candidatus Peribacteria bacterium]